MWKKLLQPESAVPAPRILPWRAVEIVPAKGACPAARALKGKRYLVDEAPRLPLTHCSSSDTCTCSYRKLPDRRTDLRREQDDTGIRRFMQPSEDRRRKRGRRKSDLEN